MIIFLWLVCLILFFVSLFVVSNYFWNHPYYHQVIVFIAKDINALFSTSRIIQRRPKYPLELWIWQTSRDHEVCEDCEERASWPPMDIADWMKEGLPGTEEACTECGEDCRCRLIPFNPKKSRKHFHQ
ncbi:MAG: hypothetical protein KAR05_02715 [Candidatus Omnitrophica bacterium]|nr:hypothetical protein [Candidatus Omnitrophota bacterium]